MIIDTTQTKFVKLLDWITQRKILTLRWRDIPDNQKYLWLIAKLYDEGRIDAQLAFEELDKKFRRMGER